MVDRAPTFEQHRAHLVGVADWITGSLADAEDAVQAAWLRWADPRREDRATSGPG